MLQENHVIDDLLDLGRGQERVKRRHRRAVQAVGDRAPQVVAVRRLAAGRRRELEDSFAVVARSRVQERRRRPISGTGNTVAVQTVAAIEAVAAGLRLGGRILAGREPRRRIDRLIFIEPQKLGLRPFALLDVARQVQAPRREDPIPQAP